MNASKYEDQALKDRVQSIAMGEAIKASTISTLAMTSAVLFLTYKNKKFAKFMSLSAKVSLPTMTGLGMFSLRYELVQHDAILHPERWGLVEYIEKRQVTKMPIHHLIMNSLYDKPFYFIAGVSLPLVGYIFNENLKLKHLTFSQKVMHTRVIAQLGIISVLLVTMGFREYMERRGRFPEPTVIIDDHTKTITTNKI